MAELTEETLRKAVELIDESEGAVYLRVTKEELKWVKRLPEMRDLLAKEREKHGSDLKGCYCNLCCFVRRTETEE